MADDALRGDLANSTDPAKGAALVGYMPGGIGAIATTIKTKLDNAPVDARDYGFSLSASSNENQQAIYQAVEKAQGDKVIIECPEDFEVVQMSMPDTYDVDLEFRGSGRLHRATGGSLNIPGDFVGVQSVSAITDGTVAINLVTEEVTKIFIANTSEYQVGDIIKIVSDDIDPDARTNYTARRGEFSICVLVEPDGIWVPRTLEDQQYYTDNVRLARMSRRRVKVQGLKIQSSEVNTNSMMIVRGVYKPYVDFEIYDHSGTGLTYHSCVSGIAQVRGTGYGGYQSDGSTNRLGYMFVDGSGKGNTIINPVGTGWRHCVTTLFPSIAENNSSLHLYGASRDLTVWNGRSFGAQNVAWDEHEGARRTRFAYCGAYNSLKGTNSARIAFQLRGRDSQVIGADVDASHEYGVAITTNGRGHHRIIGGNYRASGGIAYYSSLSPGSRPDVTIDGATSIMPNLGPSGFATAPNDNRLTVLNSRFECLNVTHATPRLFQSRDTGHLHISNSEVLVNLAGGHTTSFGLLAGETSKLTGDIRVRSTGANFQSIIRGDSGAAASTDIKVNWLAGGYSIVSDLTNPAMRYEVMDYTQSPPRAYKAVESIPATSADPISNGDISFTRVSNTSLTVKMRGSDGAVRSANLSLS